MVPGGKDRPFSEYQNGFLVDISPSAADALREGTSPFFSLKVAKKDQRDKIYRRFL